MGRFVLAEKTRLSAIFTLCLLLMAAIHALTLLEPSDAVLGVAHVGIVFLACSQLPSRLALLVTVLCSVAIAASQIFHPESKAQVEDLIERALALGAVWLTAIIMLRKQRAISQFEDSMGRHTALFETASDGMLVIGEHGVIVSANPALEAMVGREAGSLVGQHIDILIRAGYRMEHRSAMQEVVAGRMDASHLIGSPREIEIIAKDGSAVPVEITVNPALTKGHRYFSAVVRDLSEKHEAEKRTREAQRAMSTLLSNLPGMAYRCLFDEYRTMLFVSDGCRAICGCEPSDLIHNRTRAASTLIFPEDRSMVSLQIQRAVREGRPYQLIYRMVRADGEIRWVSEQGQAVTGHEGAVRCLEGFITDITPHKKIEQSLRESEERFRSIADATPFMIWATTLDKTVSFANARVMEFTGLSQDDLLGKGWINWTHPDDSEQAAQVYGAAFERWEPFVQEYRARRHDGQWRWIEVHGAPRFAPGGEFVGYIGSGKDVTERRKAVEALTESEERFRRLADFSPSIVWVDDAERRCTFVNRRWVELTGISLKESLGHGWKKALLPEDFERLSDQVVPLIERREPYQAEYRVHCRDGQFRWLLDNGTPRFDPDGQFEGYIGSAIDITDRKVAEESLRESEAQFRKLADASPNIIWLGDNEQGCLFTNRTWTELTGQSTSDSRGRGWADVVHPDDVPGLEKAAAEGLTLHGRYEAEYRVRSIDGSYRWILGTGVVRVDGAGRVIGNIGSGVDITERKIAQRRLRDQHDNLTTIHNLTLAIARGDAIESVFEQTMSELARSVKADRSAILLFDARQSMQFVAWRGVSEAHRQAVGGHSPWPADELDPQPILVRDAMTDPGVVQYRELCRNEGIRALAFVPITGQGRLLGKLMLYYAEPQTFESGEIEFARQLGGQLAVAVLRETAAKEIRLSEQRYRRLFEDSPLALLEVDFSSVKREVQSALDTHGGTVRGLFEVHPDMVDRSIAQIRIIDVNPATMSLFGADNLEHLRRQIATLFTHETAATFMELIVTLWRGATTFEAETSYQTLTGEVRAASLHCALRGAGARDWSQALFSMNDITESKRSAEELARAKRLETAGRLAGQIAHDFNNMLGPLVAYPEIIEMKIPHDERISEMLRDMQNAALQMAEINQELLTLSRRGHYSVEPMEVNDLTASATRTLEVPASVTVDLRLHGEPLYIRGGGAQLTRVLINLMKNAIDAMDDQGVLSLLTDTVYVDETLGRYTSVKRGEYVRIAVTDTGTGIPSEALEHIFEPFFTTKKTDRKRGTGLGLSVVHSVMEDHEGYVDVESTLGRGTTFWLYFPLYRGPVSACPEAAVMIPGSGESVLVVDDDPMQRRIAQNALERLGYKVNVVESGEEAVTFVTNHPHDVVILDMMMDGIDGTETLRQIRAIHPKQRAMILTGFSTSERAQTALAMGNCELLSKPIQVSALTAAIQRALGAPSVAQVVHSLA